MKDVMRQGIYRIIYDMVKADYMITENEIDFMENICSEYGITEENREAALAMSFAEAVREVKKLTQKQSEHFIDLILRLTLSDGACYREEALLVMAIQLCINPLDKADIFSFPTSKMMLDHDQMLFLENGFDEDANAQIQEHYIHLLNTTRIGGFEFVYVPKVIEQLTAPGTQLLRRMVTHLAPPRTDEETDAIVESLSSLTTERMYREMLLGKLGIDLDITDPSIVVCVGFSEVNGGKLSNFLVIHLDEDITREIDKLIDDFIAIQHVPSINIRNNYISPNAFIYSGFYKIIFDIITHRKGVKSDLMIHPYNHRNVLTIRTSGSTSTTEDPLDIGPKESAFYIFLINETLQFGGFNTACTTALDIKYMEAAQKRFEKTYFELCNRDTAPDITNPEIRRPMLSKIKKAIENHPSLVQKMMFIPETNRNKLIKVHVERKHLKTA